MTDDCKSQLIAPQYGINLRTYALPSPARRESTTAEAVGPAICRKIGYRNHIAAQRALIIIREKSGPRRNERSTYRCPRCDQWHLTSHKYD